MVIAPKPANEKERLERLLSYHIMDTAPESDFDDIVELASSICDVPISVISLLDANRQWFKAKKGLDALETQRDLSFCGHVVLTAELLEIEDATKDNRFFDNPYVMGDPNICFYAGMPLQTNDGLTLGTLCVMDKKPHLLTNTQREALQVLARQVINNMELRLKSKESLDLLEFQTKLLSILGHDIRGPINSLTGITNLFKSELMDRSEVLACLAEWENQVRNTNLLLDNIMEWGSTILNNPSFTKKEIAARQLFNEQIDVLKMKSQAKQNIFINLTAPDLMLSGERHMLSFVFRNLLDNANKFTSSGTITINAKSDGNYTHITCTDTGVGMKEKEIDALFSKERRFSKTGTQNEKGFGLGLMLSQQFIQHHDGTIYAESELHKGTTIHVKLPA